LEWSETDALVNESSLKSTQKVLYWKLPLKTLKQEQL